MGASGAVQPLVACSCIQSLIGSLYAGKPIKCVFSFSAAEFLKFYKEQSGNYLDIVDEIWEFFHSKKSWKKILEQDDDED